MNRPFSPWMSTPACILDQEVLAHLEHGDPNICVAVPLKNGKVATLPLLWALLARMAHDNNMPSYDADLQKLLGIQRAQELIALVRQRNGVWLGEDIQQHLWTAAHSAVAPLWWSTPRGQSFSDLNDILSAADTQHSAVEETNLLCVAGWMEQICGGCVGLPLAVAMLTDEHIVRDYLHSTHDIAQRMHPLLPLMQAREILRGHIRLSSTDVWRVAFDCIRQTVGDDIYHLRLGKGEDSAVFTELRNHPTGVEIANTLGWRYNQRDVWHCWNMVKISANHVTQDEKQLNRLKRDLHAAEGVLRNFLHHASVDELNQALHFILGEVLCTADTVGATNILDILHTYDVGLDTPVVDTEGNISECVKTLRQLIECTPLPTLHAYMQRKTLITAVARDAEQCLRVVRKM